MTRTSRWREHRGRVTASYYKALAAGISSKPTPSRSDLPDYRDFEVFDDNDFSAGDGESTVSTTGMAFGILLRTRCHYRVRGRSRGNSVMARDGHVGLDCPREPIFTASTSCKTTVPRRQTACSSGRRRGARRVLLLAQLSEHGRGVERGTRPPPAPFRCARGRQTLTADAPRPGVGSLRELGGGDTLKILGEFCLINACSKTTMRSLGVVQFPLIWIRSYVQIVRAASAAPCVTARIIHGDWQVVGLGVRSVQAQTPARASAWDRRRVWREVHVCLSADASGRSSRTPVDTCSETHSNDDSTIGLYCDRLGAVTRTLRSLDSAGGTDECKVSGDWWSPPRVHVQKHDGELDVKEAIATR